MEELLLGLHLALEELDVVDEEHVDIAVAPLEVGGLVVADAVDEVVRELLGVHVAHLDVRVEAAGVVADGVEEVGLAQTGLAVDEERVVGLGRGLGDGDGRGIGEAVARADDEGVEGVLRVQPGQLDLLGLGPAATGAGGRGLRVLVDEAVIAAVDRKGRGEALRLRSWFRLGGLLRLDALGRRKGVSVGEVRVDGDGQADLTAELVREGLGHRGPQPLLDEVLGEVVGNGDEGRVVEEADEASEAEEGPACYRDTVGVERFQGGAPHLAEVDVALGHVRTPSSRGSWPFGSIVSYIPPRDRPQIHKIVHRLWECSGGRVVRSDANNTSRRGATGGWGQFPPSTACRLPGGAGSWQGRAVARREVAPRARV